MNDNVYVAVPQVPSSQYWSGYDTQKRWSSYWIQIEQALLMPEGQILEIGVGNGVVTDYLRNVGQRNVTTLDIDPQLNPDVVGDIASLPFGDKAFECVMACEVLEHMPFEISMLALKEMRRVARRAIISVPNSGNCIQVELSVRRRARHYRFDLSGLLRRRTPFVALEHYWELEMEGYGMNRLRDAIASAGWQITHDMRNPHNLFHHFFVME